MIWQLWEKLSEPTQAEKQCEIIADGIREFEKTLCPNPKCDTFTLFQCPDCQRKELIKSANKKACL